MAPAAHDDPAQGTAGNTASATTSTTPSEPVRAHAIDETPAQNTGAGWHHLTPLYFLERAARTFPQRPAIAYGRRRWNYAEFGAEAQQFAKALSEVVGADETVTVIAPNIPEMLMGHYSVPLVRARLSALNPRLSTREFEYILGQSESKIVFADSAVIDQIASVIDKLPNPPKLVEIVDEEFGEPASGEHQTYREFVDAAPAREDFSWKVDDEERAIALNYTSGTTGNPKGVIYTHRGAHQAAMSAIQHYGMDKSSRYLWTLPMFHCSGWTMTWGTTAAAGTHVCLRAVRGAAIWDAFVNEHVTHLCGAPMVAASIVEAPEAVELDHNIRLITAGAAPPPSVISGLETIGITPIHVYGLTEAYGPYTICEPQDEWDELSVEERAQKMKRQGVPMLHAGDVAIVDYDMNFVPADGETSGEVVFRGNGVMREYFKNPEATAEAFRGGWYHTGDVGVMHPDGYIQLVDRLKDIIISGGENISSIEVEGVLAGHPGIQDVAVLGVPDDKWGERPMAFVTFSGEPVSEDELRAYCREHLAGFKVPDVIKSIDELPRTATGKIQKGPLRKRLAN